jgi:hypothetical protein
MEHVVRISQATLADPAGGGRTHTFGVKNAAMKLRGHAVYLRQDVIVRDGKPIPRNGVDA